jgi:tRNA-dihydrouridine synthase
VVANGDVTDAADGDALLEASGADAVMVGRGAQGKPWLPGDVAHHLATGRRRPSPDRATQRALALEHYEGLLGLYGQAVGVRHARKHLGWYLDAAAEEAGRGVPPALRMAVLTADSAAAARAALDDAYASLDREATPCP